MDPADDRREVPELRDVVRRYWLPIAICTILGAVLAGVALHIVPPRYTAHAAVLVQPINTSSEAVAVVGGRTSSGGVNLDTEAQLVKSNPVAEHAKSLLGSPSSTSALVRRVVVSVPANSSVLIISYTAGSPEAAAAGAHDFAVAYLAVRASSAQADVNVQSKAYSRQLANLNRQLQQVTDKLASESSTSATSAYDRARKATLSGQINNLSTALNLLTTTAIIPGAIIADSTPPTSPSGPSRVIYLTSGVMLGLLVGLLVGLIRTGLVKRIKRPQEIASAGVEVLASLPAGTSVSSLTSNNPAIARSVQQLCSLLTNTLELPGSVAVIGIGTDSTLVVCNLAAALAQSERRVAVICVGARARTTAEVLRADSHFGLSDVLHGRASLADSLAMSPRPGIFALGPGSANLEPPSAPAVKRIVDELRSQVDIVLVQTPPADESSDATALVLAEVTDGSLLVAEIKRTRRDRLVDVAALLNRMGCRTLGAVTVESHIESRRRPGDAAQDLVGSGPGPDLGAALRGDRPTAVRVSTTSSIQDDAGGPTSESNGTLGWPLSSATSGNGDASAGTPTRDRS